MIRLVIFDLDYTLHDDTVYWHGAFAEIAEMLEVKCGVDRQEALSVLKRILEEKTYVHPRIFDDALEALGLRDTEVPTSIIRDCVKLYREHQPTIVLYPGVLHVLERVREPYQTALLTNGTLPITERKLRVLGIEYLFDLIHCPEPAERKPSREPYGHLLKHFGVTGEETVYVGDNPTVDFPGARHFGIVTVRVLTGPFRAAQGEADYTLSSLEELLLPETGILSALFRS